MLILTLALFVASPQQRIVAIQVPPDSYADSATAALVRHARSARARNERLVTAYRAKVSQRMGIGLHALARDRMLFHQELIAQISWKRDAPSTLEWLGARMGVPVATLQDEVPGGLNSQARDLVFDPASDVLIGSGSFDNGLVLHPLSDSAESNYRFAMGSSVSMTLTSGKTIRIVGLTVIPRLSSPRLMSGTLWFDAESFNLVRAVYRPARPWDLRRDADSSDKKDMPAWLNGQLEVKYVTLDYGLYENRWWLPRFMAIDGIGTAGSWLGVPFRMERTYEDYEVEGGTPPDPLSTFVPAGRNLKTRGKPPTGTDSSRRARSTRNNALADSLRASMDSSLVVIIPADTSSLLKSTLLGPPILRMGDLVTEAELRKLAAPLKQLPARPWETHIELPRTLSALLQKVRYNRIEALSLGTSARFDFGRLQFDATARLGLADLVPNGELTLTRATPNAALSLSGYRRLAAANPEANPFSAPNSALAFLAQRDDGEYYRTLGVELTAANSNSGWWSGRVYYQQERPAIGTTDAALPHLFSNAQHFRPNILADSAQQLGGSLTLRASKAFSRRVTLGISTTIDASAGDFDYQRAALTLRAIVTPKGPVAIAASASAGTSTGTVSTQGQFFLGGPMSLRGYPGGAISGPAYWLVRLDVGTSSPGVRLIAFSDIGWAGARGDFSHGRSLISAGVGAGFLDGLLRVDLARALRVTHGWRLEFYINGPM